MSDESISSAPQPLSPGLKIVAQGRHREHSRMNAGISVQMISITTFMICGGRASLSRFGTGSDVNQTIDEPKTIVPNAAGGPEKIDCQPYPNEEERRIRMRMLARSECQRKHGNHANVPPTQAGSASHSGPLAFVSGSDAARRRVSSGWKTATANACTTIREGRSLAADA